MPVPAERVASSPVTEPTVESLGDGLSVRVWSPDCAAIAFVMIVHGIHEHGGRYAALAERLVAHGWAVIAPDLPGHGLSRGHRGDLGALDEVLGALQIAADEHFARPDRAARPDRPEHPDPDRSAHRLPRVLFGHSLGGTLSLLLAERRPDAWDGMILSGAATRPSRSPSILMPFLQLLAKVSPGFGVRRISAKDVAVSAGARESYGEDSLVFNGAVQARSAWTLWSAGKAAEADLATITCPILILHGEADSLAAPAGSQAIADGVSSWDVTGLTYAGQGHELLNEDIRDKVVDDVTRWLDERYGAGAKFDVGSETGEDTARGPVGDSDLGSVGEKRGHA